MAPLPVNGKPAQCSICPLLDAPGIVYGEGPRNAKIMLCGEAPGETEGASLIPFSGGSGRILNALLQHAKIDRKEIFVTNVVKCRPTARNAQGKLVDRAPTETEQRCCASFLAQEIMAVKPNIIVALGNVPMAFLTGKKQGITKLRSVPTYGPNRRDEKAEKFKVIGTYHPAYIMRVQDLWPAAVYDLARARTESATPIVSRMPWKRVIHARLADVGDALRRRIRDAGHYHHDLETTGLDGYRDAIRCIGIAAEADEVFCFDWTNDVIAFVRELHADPTLLTVGQNSEGFDIPFQVKKGFVFNGPTYDTLLGHHLLNPALPKDLGFIGATSTDEEYWKDDSMYKSGDDALQHGCCKDVHATARGFDDQIKELKQEGLYDLYFNHVMPLQPVLRKMHFRGVKKDIRRALGWSIVLRRKADEFEAKLKKGLGDASFNVDSPKQLMELLYKRMGLPVQYKQTREGMRPTVDADALDALASMTNNPLFKLVRTIRTLRKWDSTFINCEHDDKGFVHGHFSAAKAANGRLNSYDPNMQNFPVDVREIIVPDSEDEVLIARDWSQIEWRVAMALAGDRLGLDAIVAGRDPHKDGYAIAFDTPYDEVTKAQRDIAKAVNYGMLYGRGVDSIAAGRAGHPEDILPADSVQRYLTQVLGKLEGYRKFRDVLTQQVQRRHYVESAWGRRRWWFTRQNMPEAFNHPISSSAASMMYEVLVELENQLPKGATVRLSVHDEVVINSPKDQKTLRMTLECTREIMERPFPQMTNASLYPDIVRHYYPQGWTCPSDCHIGTNWKMTKGATKSDVLLEKELRAALGVSDLH